MSWVTIKISLPVMYIMAKMEYALTLADSHACQNRKAKIMLFNYHCSRNMCIY